MADEQKALLEVSHLRTSFFMDGQEIKAVNDVSYHVDEQEVVAIVGESGCGKSVTQLSVMQLVQTPPGKILEGEVIFEGKNLLEYKADSKKMQEIRGAKIAMIFQEPMTSLNPVFTVGNQISEVIRRHKKCTKKEALKRSIAAFESVGIPDPELRMKNYPFEMSGGMRQRVMIATAVACNSRLIIADEPTTALDVTTQAQVMELLMHIVETTQASLVLVTHNLGLVSRYADRIYVMYAGSIVESGTTEDLLTRPAHPYTIGLLKSVPKLEEQQREQLAAIDGAPPNLADMPDMCAFLPRCIYANDECRTAPAPALREVEGREGGRESDTVTCKGDDKQGDRARHLKACHLDALPDTGAI